MTHSRFRRHHWRLPAIRIRATVHLGFDFEPFTGVDCHRRFIEARVGVIQRCPGLSLHVLSMLSKGMCDAIADHSPIAQTA